MPDQRDLRASFRAVTDAEKSVLRSGQLRASPDRSYLNVVISSHMTLALTVRSIAGYVTVGELCVADVWEQMLLSYELLSN